MINLDDKNLSSSTESTNGIPFANENIGTIKQRSPFNHYNTFDTMKRSLPMDFFQQSTTTTTPIYDNNERFIDKRSQYIEVFKKDKQIKNDATNVLSDIDSMLSDLNRELDQMLDYETTTI